LALAVSRERKKMRVSSSASFHKGEVFELAHEPTVYAALSRTFRGGCK
jgi:hypothetical protein